MGLGQHVHMQVVGGDIEGAGLGIADAGQDDQDAIGAGGARLIDLIGVEQEVLAQQRQAGASMGGGEIVEMALERGAVGQNRQAGGAAGLIGAGENWGIEFGADQSLGRAG